MKIDEKNKEIHIKIMYYGPASSGKKTTLNILHAENGKRGKLEILPENNQLSLSFNYGSIEYRNKNYRVFIRAFSSLVPPSHLSDIDGVIFIADSSKISHQSNLKSWNEFTSRFQDSLGNFPIMICFNKQDLEHKFEYMRFLDDIEYKKYKNLDIAQTISNTGEGILNSFEQIINLIYLFYE